MPQIKKKIIKVLSKTNSKQLAETGQKFVREQTASHIEMILAFKRAQLLPFLFLASWRLDIAL